MWRWICIIIHLLLNIAIELNQQNNHKQVRTVLEVASLTQFFWVTTINSAIVRIMQIYIMIIATGQEINHFFFVFDSPTSLRVQFQVHSRPKLYRSQCSAKPGLLASDERDSIEGENQINYQKWILNLMISRHQQKLLRFCEWIWIEYVIKICWANFPSLGNLGSRNIIYDLFLDSIKFVFVWLFWSMLEIKIDSHDWVNYCNENVGLSPSKTPFGASSG